MTLTRRTGAGNDPALQVENLIVPFGDCPGLSNINLSVRSGERVVLVGASGAGKTSLLRAIAGLAAINGGRVVIAAQDVTIARPEHRGAVYLHQTPVLFPHLSVQENVAFPLRVRHVPQADISPRVTAALDAVKLGDFGGRRPQTLSGGQQHRVALARAIVSEPPLLLLDEPLSALDPALRQEVRDAIISAQRSSGAGVLLITHDLDEASLLGDRIAVLLNGTIAQVATPSELFTRPASLEIARFLGFPNRIDGIVQDDGRFHSALGAWASTERLPRGPAVAVFPAAAVVMRESSSLVGRVAAVRHRPYGTTLLIDVQGVLLEGVAPRPVPAVGDRLPLAVDCAQIVLYRE